MDGDTTGVLYSIQGLVRAITLDLGIYAGYSEGNHPARDGVAVTQVSVYVEIDGKPVLHQASTHPRDGEMSLSDLRDELCRFIVQRKKEAA